MSHLELSVAESGAEITRLSASCQELKRECERLIADVNAHEQAVGGMLDLLELSRALAANDREALHASFEDDV